MNICFVCVSLRAGGAERVISILANEMCSECQVTIITLRRTEPFYPLDRRVRLVQNPSTIKPRTWWVYFPLLFWFLAKSFYNLRPEFVLSFGETISSFIVASLLFRPSKILVFSRANPEVSKRGFRSIVNPIFFRFASCLVFQTEAARNDLAQKYPFARTAVINNPVHQVPGQKALTDRNRAIVTSGFLGGQKNQAALIRAFAQCRSREGWVLNVLGDGPDMQKLQDLAEELGLAHVVRFHGYVRDVREWLAASQIFAFTSLTEGFPNSLAEAMASGCACVAYDCPVGPADLIEENENGLLVPCDAESAFAESLERLMSDGNLRARLGKSAIKSMERFDHRRIVSELRALLASLQA